MKRNRRPARKPKTMVPTTIRFSQPVLDALARGVKVTDLSTSAIANILLLAGDHAVNGNTTAVNAARKLLAGHAAAAHDAAKAAALRAVNNKAIREAKAVLNGEKRTEQTPPKQKPNAA